MKILIWFLALFILIFIIATVIIALYGKKIVEIQIEKNLKMETHLDSMSLNFPFTVNLNNLEVGKLFKADKISISPNIFSLFPKKLVLGTVVLVRPLVSLEQAEDGSLNIPKFEQKGARPPVLITGLVIKGGRFIFIDHKVRKEGFKVLLNNINASISKVTFPLNSLSVNFRLSVDIMDSDYKIIGSAVSGGHIDFTRKNMDVNMKIKDLDITYFSSYYGTFISKRKLLSAKLNFNSKLEAENNDLNINSKLRLSNLIYAETAQVEGELPELNLAKDALDLFTDENGNLDLEFEIKTKLDNPSLSVEQLKKVILKAAAKNLMSSNPVTLIEKIQQKLDQYKGLGEQFKKIFR
ncbi:MAG: DUF748 domain-containing protein [Candidatus Omnitrophota bacterium]